VTVIALVVVAALVVTLTATGLGPKLSTELCRLIAAIEGNSGASCGSASGAGGIRSAEDHVPLQECVVSNTGGENSVNATVVVTLDSGETWLIEQLGDGRYKLTYQVQGGASISLGVGGGVTVTVDNTTYGGEASASISGGLQIAGGQSFYVSSIDAANQLLDQRRVAAAKSSLGPLRGPVDSVLSFFGEDQTLQHLQADEWFVEGGMNANASAAAGGGVPGMSGYASAGASEEAYLGHTQRLDNTSTDYLRMSASVDVSASSSVAAGDGSVAFLTAGVGGEISGVVEIDRDANGNPVAMRMVSTVGGYAQADISGAGADTPYGGSSYTTHTAQIPLETASDKQVAARVLQTLGILYVRGVTDVGDVGQRAWTPSQFVDAATDFGNLAADRGYMWEQKYTNDSSTDFAVQADGTLGISLGIGEKSTSSTMHTTSYTYWDGRAWVTRAGCVV
jgi:hypothetical protein